MAKCPKCKLPLTFRKIGFLRRGKNRMQCPHCSTFIESEVPKLNVYGGVGGGVASILIIWNKEIFGNHSYAIWIALGSALFILIILSSLQHDQIQFNVSENQEAPELSVEEKRTKPKPRLPKKPNKVDYLKHRYYYKSNSELEGIASTEEMTPEAKEAALELLRERKNS